MVIRCEKHISKQKLFHVVVCHVVYTNLKQCLFSTLSPVYEVKSHF